MSGVAALLSFLYPGVGQMYAGHVGRGLAIAFTPVIAIVVFLMFSGGLSRFGQEPVLGVTVTFWVLLAAYLMSFVWQVYDAAQCVEKGNRARRRPTRRRPRSRSRRRFG